MATKNSKKLHEPVALNDLKAPRWTDRDFAIVESVYIHRGLTQPQIQALHFGDTEGQKKQCQRRLRVLFDNRMLGRKEQPTMRAQGSKPYLYYLKKLGAQWICDEREIELDDLHWKPKHIRDMSYVNVPHFVATNDVRVAIELDASRLGMPIHTWHDDRTLKSKEMKDYVTIINKQTGTRRKVAVIADGYFHLEAPEYHFHFLLEIDMSTEGSKKWKAKIAGHLEYFRSGKYQERYKTKGQRILTITTTQRRLENLKEWTEEAGGRRRFWFTTFDQITPQTVLSRPIWYRGGETDLVSLI